MRRFTVNTVGDYGDDVPVECVALDDVLLAIDSANLLFDVFARDEMKDNPSQVVQTLYERIQFGIKNYAKDEIKKAIKESPNDYPINPPCPVCGVVPKSEYLFIRVSCGCIMHKDTEVVDTLYCRKVFEYLGRALRASGITTIAQLNDRLSPDPRVAVLERVAKCAETYMDATAHCSGNQFYDDAALGLANAIIDMYNTQNQPAEE